MYCVYEVRSASGRLLYVGYTCNPERREKQHRSCKFSAAGIRFDVVASFETKGEALDHERALIKAHRPPHNVEGTGRRMAAA